MIAQAASAYTHWRTPLRVAALRFLLDGRSFRRRHPGVVSAMSSTDLANGYISPSGDYGIYGLRPGSYIVEFATQDYWDDNIGVWVQLGIPTEYFDDAAYAECDLLVSWQLNQEQPK